MVCDPVELLEWLAALTPRPRIHLVRYHGVRAPRAAWRKGIVPWADPMQRSFGCDVLAGSRCPGRLTWVALIRETAVILCILRHLGLPDDVPVMRPARDPPLPFDGDAARPPSDD